MGKSPWYLIGGWIGPSDAPNNMEKWKFIIIPGHEI
jgi:hypothetical protein